MYIPCLLVEECVYKRFKCFEIFNLIFLLIYLFLFNLFLVPFCSQIFDAFFDVFLDLVILVYFNAISSAHCTQVSDQCPLGLLLIIKNAKSNEASNSMLIFRQKKMIDHLFLCQCLVQNMHNKLMDNALELPKTP